MKISQIIITETTAGATSSGSVAPVETAFSKTQTRNASIYGDKKVGSLFKGKKTNKPYANSLSEGKVKELDYDLKNMKPTEFKKKYGKSREEIRASFKKPQPTTPTPVSEDTLGEEEKLLKPGMGNKFKPGFHKIDPDKAEKEGQTLKNSLHTIVRVATHLDKALSTRDNFPEWVSEKIGGIKSEIVTVMNYLISSQEMKHDSDAMDEGAGVIAGGLQYEDTVNEKAVSKAQQRFMGMAHAIQKGKKIPGASKELKSVAKGMTKKAAHDFAATKHKGLPEKVKKKD